MTTADDNTRQKGINTFNYNLFDSLREPQIFPFFSLGRKNRLVNFFG